MTLRQGDDLFSEDAVAIRHWLIAAGTGAHAHDAQCASFAWHLAVHVVQVVQVVWHRVGRDLPRQWD